MKKKFLLFIAIVLGYSLICAGGSAEKSVIYNIPELGLEISLPESWIATDRNVQDDNPICSIAGMSASEFHDQFFNEDVYFIATDPDIKYFLQINSFQCIDPDYNQLTDDELASMLEENKDLLEDEFNILEAKASRYNETFVSYYLEQKTDGSKVLHGLTALGGKSYALIMNVFSSSGISADFQLLENLLKGIKINTVSGNGISNSSENTDGWKTVYIQEKKISVMLPDEFEAITLETTESPLFDKNAIANAQEIMKANGNYLDAFNPETNREITANVSDSIIPSMNFLSDKDIEDTIVSVFEKQGKDKGLTLTKHELIKAGNTKMLKTWGHVNHAEGDYDILQYGTIIDNQSVWITLMSYDGSITKADESLLDEIWQKADLIKHEEYSSDNNASGSRQSTLYTDKDSNFSFEIPAGWEEVPLYQKRNYVKTKIAPNGNMNAACILYFQTDMLSQVSTLDKLIYRINSRKDLDAVLIEELDNALEEQSVWTSEPETNEYHFLEFASDLNLRITEKKEFNGMPYYIGQSSSQIDVLDGAMSFETENQYAIIVHNGYCIMIGYQDLSQNQKYKNDYEDVIKSFITLNQN